MHTYICIHTYVYTYRYIRIYIHTYIHIYTYIQHAVVIPSHTNTHTHLLCLDAAKERRHRCVPLSVSFRARRCVIWRLAELVNRRGYGPRQLAQQLLVFLCQRGGLRGREMQARKSAIQLYEALSC